MSLENNSIYANRVLTLLLPSFIISGMEWLNNLKYGDEVVILSGGHGKSLARVSRTTTTQIVLESGTKFRKSDGQIVGADAYSILRLAQPTEALRVAIQKGVLCEKLRRVVWEKMGVDTLAAIWDIAKNGQHV